MVRLFQTEGRTLIGRRCPLKIRKLIPKPEDVVVCARNLLHLYKHSGFTDHTFY